MVEVSRRVVKIWKGELFYTEISLLRIKKKVFKVNVFDLII